MGTSSHVSIEIFLKLCSIPLECGPLLALPKMSEAKSSPQNPIFVHSNKELQEIQRIFKDTVKGYLAEVMKTKVRFRKKTTTTAYSPNMTDSSASDVKLAKEESDHAATGIHEQECMVQGTYLTYVSSWIGCYLFSGQGECSRDTPIYG